VACALALAACGGGDTDKPAAGTGMTAATPSAGGAITINLVTDSRVLDPFAASLSTVADYSRMTTLYDVLVWADPNGTVHPQIAESLTPDEDGRVWTLVLRPDVKFSDGTPYDAAAVKFTWEKIADPATRSPHGSSARGLTTEVVDARTLRVTLQSPNRRFDQIVASNLGFIASPAAYAKDPQGFSRNPVGAGPFTLKEWVSGSHQTYVRNPGYWQPGKPLLDQVTFRTVTDQTQSFRTVQNGESDMVITVDSRNAALGRKAGFDLAQVELNGPQGAHLNARRAPFDDVRARQAVSLAIDREEFVRIVAEGEATAARELFTVNSPLIDHAAAADQITDRERAKRLAQQLADEGKPLNFTFTVPQSANSVRAAEYLQQRWSTLPGANVRVEYIEIGAFITKTQVNRDYQSMYFQWATPGEPQLWNYLHSTSPSNYIGYSSPAADAALAESRAAATPEQLKAAYTKLAQVFAEEVPTVALYDVVSVAYARPGRLGGFVFTSGGAVLMDRLGLVDP
jgi:peptide/nickel transport system substrate-binding protein